MKDYMKELANSGYANAVKSIYDGIKEANNIAAKESIKANTVFINNRFAKVKEHVREQRFNDGISSYEYELDVPPMICGLEAYFTDELPEEFAFAVTNTPQDTRSKYEKLKAENEELKQQLESIKQIIGGLENDWEN